MLDKPHPNNDPSLWGDNEVITSADDYKASLTGRGLRVFLMGEQIEEPSNHPIIAPSVNAMAATFELAEENENLATIHSPIPETRINRFLPIAQSADDLVGKARMQHALGQKTGTCFQRCVGLDAINALHSVTFDIDEAHNTDYHTRFLAFLKEIQRRNQVIGGAMTDAKGDRSKAPHEQSAPDVYVHVKRSDEAGGLMVTMPSEQDLNHGEIGPLVRKFLVGRTNSNVEDRIRILRLIENMTLGRNAVGYLTESLQGA